MKKNTLLFVILTACFFTSHAQQNVGINTTTPDPSAALHIESTNKGVLVPRLTTDQRQTISNAATGLLVFDTDSGSFWFYNGTAWVDLSAPDGDADPANELQTLSYDPTNKLLALSKGNDVDLSALDDAAAAAAVQAAIDVHLTDDQDVDPMNEIQTLSYDPDTKVLAIANGNDIDLSNLDDAVAAAAAQAAIDAHIADDQDVDPMNEIQALSYDPATQLLSLSDSDTVDLSGLNNTQELVWEKTGDDIFYKQGKVGVGLDNPSHPFEVSTNTFEPAILDANQSTVRQVAQGDLWQSFTASVDGNITELEASLDQGPSTGTLYLYEGEGTEGALLYSQAYDSLVQGWQSFLVDIPVRLTAAATYTFRLDNAEWNMSNGDKYAGGRSSTDPAKDFAFKTFMAEEMQNTTVVVTENRVGIANITPEHTLDVGGNIKADTLFGETLDVAGNVKADTLFGDASQLTGIQAGDLSSLLQVTLPDGTTLYVYPTDNGAGIPWGDVALDIGVLPNIPASSEAIMDFNGEFNTQVIVGHQGNFNNGVYAAKLCAQWQAFGFDDWYLPAAGELDAMEEQLGPGGSGDIPDFFYWSSSEGPVGHAWLQDFSNGPQYYGDKNFTGYRCRCVRR